MPEEFDTEYDDQQASGAARRVQEKSDAEKIALQTENAILKAGLTDLNPEQTTALKAVLGENLEADAVKAKAEALGFVKPAETPAEQPSVDAAASADAEQRISEVAAESSHQTHVQVSASWRDRLTSAPMSQMQVGGPLYQQVLAEIQATPNLSIGAVDHDGQFQPT